MIKYFNKLYLRVMTTLAYLMAKELHRLHKEQEAEEALTPRQRAVRAFNKGSSNPPLLLNINHKDNQ